jgi:hypothetical protein
MHAQRFIDLTPYSVSGADLSRRLTAENGRCSIERKIVGDPANE